MSTMRAVAFRGTNQLVLEDRPKPQPKAGQAVIRITTTTICGTDVHIVKGEYPVRPGLVLGHEPVGVIEALGEGLEPEYQVGQRVIVGAITPCGQCFYCLNGSHSQCGGPLGGWRFGNTIDGAWAEYLLVPDARANLAHIPDDSHRRAGRARARHLLDGTERGGKRQRQGGRCGGGLRPGPHRTLRDARREAARRGPHHRRGFRSRAPRDGQALRRQRRRSTTASRTRSPQSSG